MLVLCAYLGAMAGITALCYVFRKRPDEVIDGDPTSLKVDDQNKLEQPVDDAPGILVTPPPPSCETKTRTRGRSSLTPETQAKIQEVLDFVNTPSDQLVLQTSKKHSAKSKKSQPPLELPVYGPTNMKKPKEVIDDLKQSKAKVEAWISKLDKVINDDEMEPLSGREKRRKISVGSAGSGSGSVKSNKLGPVSAEMRKNAHSERLAKVKEEMAKRQTAVSSKASASSEQHATTRQEKSSSSSTAARGSAVGHKREVVEVPKRASHESNGSAAAARATRMSRQQSSHGSANTAEEQKTPVKKATTKEEKEAAAKAVRASRSRGIRRTPVTSQTKQQAEERETTNTVIRTRATRPEAVKAEPVQQRAKTQQTKPVSAFEVRMKYVPTGGRQPRPTSPPSEVKGRSQAATTSKIPVLVNSRMRPPVARPSMRGVREQKPSPPPPPPAPVVQKPKKSIRITNEPPLASRRVEYLDVAPAPPPGAVELVLAERRSSSRHTSRHNMARAASLTRDGVTAPEGGRYARNNDEADAGVSVLPELNIIDVRGSRSFNPQQLETDLHSDLHYAAREVAARIAKSGPIKLGMNSSFNNRDQHQQRNSSSASLRNGSSHGRSIVLPAGSTTVQSPVSVSKTVQLPEGTEDNVTVYFSVTMPRRANSDLNWNGHDDSDHTITVDNVCGNESVITSDVDEITASVVGEEMEDVCSETRQTVDMSVGGFLIDEDDHSDDGVFPDELSGHFPDGGSDNDVETDDQSSVCGYDGKEFDSCDEQF